MELTVDQQSPEKKQYDVQLYFKLFCDEMKHGLLDDKAIHKYVTEKNCKCML